MITATMILLLAGLALMPTKTPDGKGKPGEISISYFMTILNDQLGNGLKRGSGISIYQ